MTINAVDISMTVGAGGVLTQIPPAATVSLSLSLSGAGRIGFYKDYSELTTAGTHTFYVCRTHGTTGTVGVTYTTSGDDHTVVTGSLSWADGEADIKSIEVPVTAGNLSTHGTTNGLGEHRIVMTLSSATGGAALHRDSASGNWTRAYGIIDNATMIASDSNAYFVDFDAGTNGTGTAASPYNNFPSVRSAQNSSKKRYIYLQGTYQRDNVYLDMDTGGAVMGGTSEATRTYFMQWPGQTAVNITDDGTLTTNGWYSDTSGNCDYITWKNITHNGLDNTNTGGPGWAWRARTSNKSWTIEHCSVLNQVQANTSGQAAVYLEGTPRGCNIYNCNFDTLTRGNGNEATAIEAYDGGTHSITSCTFEDTNGVYQKDAPSNGDFAMTVKHCVFGDKATLTLDGLGTNQLGKYSLVQGNVFNGTVNSSYQVTDLAFGTVGTKGSGAGEGVWVVGNIIHASGSNDGDTPAVIINWHESGVVIFNNVFQNGRGCVRTPSGVPVEYLNYNHEYNNATAGSDMWHINGTSYTSTANMTAAVSAYQANISTGDPLFTNFPTDVTLGGSSPLSGAGVSGTDIGVYLVGNEQIGAA